MSERLPRNLPPAEKRDRYGTWDLTLDHPGAVPQSSSQVRGADDAADGEADAWEGTDEEQVRLLMRRQRRWSLSMAALLLGPVLAFVVASVQYPDVMAAPIGHGFSISLLTGALIIYPVTWVVAVVYTLVSNRMDGLR